jgi:hypothetical protein
MNAAASITTETATPRAASRLEIGAERRKAAELSDDVLAIEHDRAWRDAFAVVGPWSPQREALVAGLCLEMERRGLR